MFSIMKTREREWARRLRRLEGRSVKEIARVVGVAPSTVSLWVRDIELTDEQHAVLAAANGMHYRQIRARAVMSERARKRRSSWQQEGRSRAKNCEPTYPAGCMLFWAEGDKARNAVRLANSDPEVVRYFVDERTAFESHATSSRTTTTDGVRSRISGWGRWTCRVAASASQSSIGIRGTARRSGRTSFPTERAGLPSIAPRSPKRSTARSRSWQASTGRSGSTCPPSAAG
jgi:hypothetical protein